MMPFPILAAALIAGSSPVEPGIIPAFASIGGGPVFAASSTNVTWPVTNAGVVYSQTALLGATCGDQYTITYPSNITVTAFENFTPEVAGVVNNQTTWVTNGVFRWRLRSLSASGSPVASSGSVRIGYATGSQTVYAFSNFVAGSLANDLYTNLVAMTNAGRDGILWDAINASTWTWHTNSVIYGKDGYTGLSQMSSFNGGFPWKWTAITKRHAYSAGHVFGPGTTNGYIYFVGADGVTVPMYVSDCRWNYGGLAAPTYNDYCIVFFNADLPATIQPIKVCVNTNFFARTPMGKTSVNFPGAWLETCQHGRIGSQNMEIFDNHQMHQGGDSGNPAFFIHGTNLVNYQGTSGTLLSTTNFINDLNAMTISAGLSTNDYQPTYFDLSGYPTY